MQKLWTMRKCRWLSRNDPLARGPGRLGLSGKAVQNGPRVDLADELKNVGEQLEFGACVFDAFRLRRIHNRVSSNKFSVCIVTSNSPWRFCSSMWSLSMAGAASRPLLVKPVICSHFNWNRGGFECRPGQSAF